MKKKVIKNKGGRPPEYPYANMAVDQSVVLVYKTEEELSRSRCASYQIGHSHKWKFKTKNRETDAGKFELTVKRVS